MDFKSSLHSAEKSIANIVRTEFVGERKRGNSRPPLCTAQFSGTPFIPDLGSVTIAH